MTTLIGANEAARLLGVTKPTLYAYVSRGLIERQTAVDGRTSLYPREAIEALAARRRKRSSVERPSIDIQIGSSITHLSDDAVTYRGHDVAELARSHSFESVAELLWTGKLPVDSPRWRVDRDALARCRTVIEAAGEIDPITALILAVTTLGDAEDVGGSAVPVAQRLLAIAPSLLGGPQRGHLATRLASEWVSRPDPALVSAIDRALVLLADHELATSTLAVRVATSVRTHPSAALACGLATVGGRLHGRTANLTIDLFRSSEESGAHSAVRRWLDAGARLPGFGHSVYRNGDPRFQPLLATVAELPDPYGRWPIVTDVLAEAGRLIGHLPNIDYALGALQFVADLPDDAPIFAIARIAGWAAHHDEELGERPLRYRGLTRTR